MNARTRTHRALALGLALSGLGAFGAAAAPALAQYGGGAPVYNNGGGPVYNSWQPGWDAGNYDRRHILIGTVTSFTPYRMQLAGPRGQATSVDLVQGTVIRPMGLNLAPGERVAVLGHWSKGTFIAYRVVLRRG